MTAGGVDEIQYYQIEGAAGRYFKCPNGVGKLSDTACSKLYLEAMSPRGLRDGLRFACRNCPIGASHAGAPPPKCSIFDNGLQCARCFNPASRLIRSSICVSCYNREREFLIGKNGKGNRPVHAKPVGPAIVACVVNEGRTMQIRRMDKVTGQLEAVVSVLRNEPDTVLFGWVGNPVIKGGRGEARRSLRG